VWLGLTGIILREYVSLGVGSSRRMSTMKFHRTITGDRSL
jgi:hypothetical protein